MPRATHGCSRKPVYAVWKQMMYRCHDKDHPYYAYYGGRGIAVCVRWHDFVNFLADMGEPAKGMSLDRVNNDLGYTKENCAWRSKISQQNNMRSNRLLELDGKTMTVAEWSRELGISKNTLGSRVKNGWDDRRILTTPVDSKFAPLQYRS